MTQTTEPVAGMMVTSNVRLVKPLGSGGMGCVWLADHLTLRTQVAVKFVALEKASVDKKIVPRFMREAGLTAKMKSPHAVKVHDHGVTDHGLPYIVMERLVGQTLFDRLRKEGPLGLSDATAIMTQACRALADAHKRGIIHRDIKPSNLFLDDSDEPGEIFVKLLDFGLAKQEHPLSYTAETTVGAVLGTPSYMSPEQALSSKEVDARADLWALSVVIYQVLTVRLPFAGETIGSLCVAIAQGDFKAPSAIVPDLPPSIDSFFARALARDPGARFGSAKELAAAFCRAAEGQVLPSPPAPSPSPPSPSPSPPAPPSSRTRIDTEPESAPPPRGSLEGAAFDETASGSGRSGRPPRTPTALVAAAALIAVFGISALALSQRSHEDELRAAAHPLTLLGDPSPPRMLAAPNGVTVRDAPAPPEGPAEKHRSRHARSKRVTPSPSATPPPDGPDHKGPDNRGPDNRGSADPNADKHSRFWGF